MANQNFQDKGKPVSPLLKGEIAEIWGRGRWKNLFLPVDISSLVFFRIFFGLVMLVEVYRYFDHNWIKSYWITPKFHFTYWPFHFLSPLPGNGMYILFFLLGVLALCITTGLFYRLSTSLFFLGFSYTYLLEQTRYMNHFYLVILISFILIFIPAHKSASLDAVLFKKIRSETAPAWALWLVRFMIGVPYFFGGIAKINADWLQGQPLKMWLAEDLDFPLIGPYFTEDWMILLMAYSGLLLDLLIVPMLLFRKTRVIGLILISTFHIMNAGLFEIGIFPWFMLGATTLYFSPAWPRRFINQFSPSGTWWPLWLPTENINAASNRLNFNQKVVAGALACWVSLQVFLPFRHLLYPGNVHWTEEGHLYAWHMKLRTKRGKAIFTVRDKQTGQTEVIRVNRYLKKWQRKKMEGNPTLIWQFCQIVRQEYRKKGKDVAVYADVIATLNGRKYQQFIHPGVDLAAQPRPVIPPAPWIIPLRTPLSHRLKKSNPDYASRPATWGH